jgi:hypothetical protein
MAAAGSGASTGKGTDYYPLWLDNLADDVTLEAPAMNGTAKGAKVVHEIVTRARELYEFQDFKFHDKCGDTGYFLEDYVSSVQGEPLRVLVLVTLNSAGKAQHIVVNHRPRNTLLLFSHLMHEKFAGTPTADHFLAEEPETDRPTTIGTGAHQAL